MRPNCRCLRRLKPTIGSWRVDETYIRVKGKWVYLYRAVDSIGAPIGFLLSAKGDAAAAERFLAKALGGENHPAPGHQHRRARRLSAGHRAAAERREALPEKGRPVPNQAGDERTDFQQYDPECQAITTRWGAHEPTLPIPDPRPLGGLLWLGQTNRGGSVSCSVPVRPI